MVADGGRGGDRSNLVPRSHYCGVWWKNVGSPCRMVRGRGLSHGRRRRRRRSCTCLSVWLHTLSSSSFLGSLYVSCALFCVVTRIFSLPEANDGKEAKITNTMSKYPIRRVYLIFRIGHERVASIIKDDVDGRELPAIHPAGEPHLPYSWNRNSQSEEQWPCIH